MQEELLQFKLQNVWVHVDLPKGTGYCARIEAKNYFLAMLLYGFTSTKWNGQKAFLYGQIEERSDVVQPPGDEDH
ncbi:hypothetical protein Tco_0702834 [Tanacetum coccineum]|uniref:Uncharacterized protein n=1 Tax=Tanacetum coccineum TaxID=301880 RepID=A0ABQ4XZ06_9ASTR